MICSDFTVIKRSDATWVCDVISPMSVHIALVNSQHRISNIPRWMELPNLTICHVKFAVQYGTYSRKNVKTSSGEYILEIT